MLPRHHQSGFTLVELIVVIVIVSILSVGTFDFISNSVRASVDHADRQARARIAGLISERISRDLRDSLPNSVRVNLARSCIEMIPVKAQTYHVNAPVTPVNSDVFDIAPFVGFAAGDIDTSTDRVALNPDSAPQVYNLGTPAILSDTIDALISPGSVAGSQQVQLDGNHAFVSDSPSSRLFIVSNPIRYCLSGTRVIRYANYGFESDIESNMTNPSSTVVGSDLESLSFNYFSATTERSAIAVLEFEISENDSVTDQDHSIRQEVSLRNAP